MSHSSLLKLDKTHRIVAPDQTYQRALPLMDVIGVTSLIDVTDYDVLPFPTYTINMKDHTAYGKGVDPLQSQVSAMMEAIERFSARQLPSSAMLAQSAEMRQLHRILEPGAIIDSEVSIPDDVLIEWIPGTDLISNETVWVPAYYVVLKQDLSGPSLLKVRTTNGVASGNTFEEAVCHALYEVVERDAWTLAWIQSITVPQMRYLAQNIKHRGGVGWNDIDFSSYADDFPLINIESLPNSIRELVREFEKTGLKIIIRDITSDIGIATFLVACCDSISDYYGMGTHLSSDVALIRAITECAQMYHVRRRLAINGKNNDHYIDKLRRKMTFSPSRYIDFNDILSYYNKSLSEDIDVILAHLIRSGIDQIITIDLTHQELNIPVVRTLIPGLESWSTHNFSPNHCFLGRRGRKYVSP